MVNNRSKQNGSKTGVVLATLAGLLVVVVVGAWLLMQDGNSTRNAKPGKPTVEVSR